MLFTLLADRHADLFAHAREDVDREVPYRFTANEVLALMCFFTSLNQRVFLMHGLPSNIMTALAAMYSRMKNKRGVRGTFVDSFLPALLASTLDEVQAEPWNGDGVAFLKDKGIKSLDAFLDYDLRGTQGPLLAFTAFLQSIRIDPKYIRRFTSAKRVRDFLSLWLDKYGHNSIGRMGHVCICMENISILAAKSIEWVRPGAGHIELSTRFVDMNGAEFYDIAAELEILGAKPKEAREFMARCFDRYAFLSGGDAFNGPLPTFYRDRYSRFYEADASGLTTGIIGETCDVLGNLLPAATRTSVCTAVSGEALSSVLRHLLLDGTPENAAIVKAIIREAGKIGADQYCRHYEPTPMNRRGWAYLSHNRDQYPGEPTLFSHPPTVAGYESILTAFGLKDGFEGAGTMADIAAILFAEGRTDHDKLPGEFEDALVSFCGCMSFRGWRDLQRQGLSSHRRTLLTPRYGFYEYDKPHPDALREAFNATDREGTDVWNALDTIPPFMRQYFLPLGFKVGYTFGCNLRQFEFCSWQRTDWSVNHEVRKEFMVMEREFRRLAHWWPEFSRADLEPAFVFARGAKPLALSAAV